MTMVKRTETTPWMTTAARVMVEVAPRKTHRMMMTGTTATTTTMAFETLAASGMTISDDRNDRDDRDDGGDDDQDEGDEYDDDDDVGDDED
jgi:hypothetical protein